MWERERTLFFINAFLIKKIDINEFGQHKRNFDGANWSIIIFYSFPVLWVSNDEVDHQRAKKTEFIFAYLTPWSNTLKMGVVCVCARASLCRLNVYRFSIGHSMCVWNLFNWSDWCLIFYRTREREREKRNRWQNSCSRRVNDRIVCEDKQCSLPDLCHPWEESISFE